MPVKNTAKYKTPMMINFYIYKRRKDIWKTKITEKRKQNERKYLIHKQDNIVLIVYFQKVSYIVHDCYRI